MTELTVYFNLKNRFFACLRFSIYIRLACQLTCVHLLLIYYIIIIIFKCDNKINCAELLIQNKIMKANAGRIMNVFNKTKDE